jgi:hypothetical protein
VELAYVKQFATTRLLLELNNVMMGIMLMVMAAMLTVQSVITIAVLLLAHTLILLPVQLPARILAQLDTLQIQRILHA